ncbi:MAG: hypothetical protein V4574_06655 [Pseudomonadota bacterium]
MAKAKAAAGWRPGFLCALRTSGNVTLAARRVGVDRGTAYALRKADAGFAASWARAVAKAAALAAAGELKAPAAGAAIARDGGDGAAGLVVRRSKNGGTQVVRAGPGRWSAGTELDFLEALAKTACVRRAAAAVGFSPTAIYARRNADAGFSARWDAVLKAGEARVGDFLTAVVLAAFDPEVAASGIPAASVSEAIQIAKWKGIGGAKAEAEARDVEGMRTRVVAQIMAIKRARLAAPADAEPQEGAA